MSDVIINLRSPSLLRFAKNPIARRAEFSKGVLFFVRVDCKSGRAFAEVQGRPDGRREYVETIPFE